MAEKPVALEDETFSADGATIIINGVIAHPGYAKNKLVNAIKIAGKFCMHYQQHEWAPEATEKREGFVHPVAYRRYCRKSNRLNLLFGILIHDLLKKS